MFRHVAFDKCLLVLGCTPNGWAGPRPAEGYGPLGSPLNAVMTVDYVRVYAIPEPSGVMILSTTLLGLLAHAWRRRRLSLYAVCVVALLAGQADAANYYISTTGSDTTGNGSVSNPYRTIQKGADRAQHGDNVYVRGGTYRETVTVQHSGQSGSPITFQPYQNEQVTVTGLDAVNSVWSPYSGSIYSTTVASGGASQLFVGGQMMTEARFPNAGYNNPFHAATNTYTGVSFSPSTPIPPNPGTLATITDSALGAPANGGTWNGAKVAVTTGAYQWSVLARTIQSSTSTTVTYATGEEEDGSDFYPVAGNHYYIGGTLAALNASKEWHYDSSHSTLYLQAPGNVNPSTLTVEARKRQVGFDLGSRSYVTVQGFSLKAATINVAGDHNTIDNCQILYPTSYTAPAGWQGASGVLVSGQHNTITNSEIGYSWGDGVTITNTHNTVNNNIIHDVGWGGNEAAFVNTTGSNGLTAITNNTMYNAGRCGVVLNSGIGSPWAVTPNTVIEHNDISRYGRLTDDLGGVYMFATDTPGTSIAYNHIDGAGIGGGHTAGVYLDSSTNGKEAGMTVHHNLITNSRIGIYAKGCNERIYNNTIWDVGYQAMVPGADPGNIETVNNLSNSDYFTGTSVSNNRYQTVNQFTNSAAGDYTLTANSSGTNPGPTYKRAADYGVERSPYTNGYTGAAPDAGAFESGVTPWTAGASFKTWTAGNQRVAPLSSALYVRSNGTRYLNMSGICVGRYSTSDSYSRRSFVKFDLTGLSDMSVPIAKAVLRLYENAAPDNGTGDVTLYRVTSAWDDKTVHYDESVDASISGWYDPANLDLYTDIDITEWVQAWLDDPSSNQGVSLRSAMEWTAGSAKFWDGFYGVTGPQLLITVPEPRGISIMATALLGLLAYAYRRQYI
jgi:hypothetical protein